MMRNNFFAAYKALCIATGFEITQTEHGTFEIVQQPFQNALGIGGDIAIDYCSKISGLTKLMQWCDHDDRWGEDLVFHVLWKLENREIPLQHSSAAEQFKRLPHQTQVDIILKILN